MKRDYYEISDDEWDQHEEQFKPSRILKRPNSTPPSPPPIESFAYNNTNNNCHDEDDDCVEITRASAAFPDELDDLEDADVDNNNSTAAAAPNRGRRFIIDDDDEDGEEEESNQNRNRNVAELYEIGSSSSEEIEEEEVMEGDVVGRALHKCAKISAELKGELFGSSVTACDRYSEVESSSVRIVTQDDVDVACGYEDEDSDFQPLLKPYQLVGVNFLLLLYRKRIGGGKS
ncbi:hypothetical protein Ahy_A10g046855 isoform A [Arachis hypogaea]|uniref:Uncharacterized protein n=1 Tax=Arachis hypogaea TaxID=3818 RepID=A0A445B0T1_ARAHY|nr:hypothetical protein Ahy_A10g046855 isoform A [Arachis hypogaea]